MGHALGHFHGRNFEHAANRCDPSTDPTGWCSDGIHPDDRGRDELRRVSFEALDGQDVATP